MKRFLFVNAASVVAVLHHQEPSATVLTPGSEPEKVSVDATKGAPEEASAQAKSEAPPTNSTDLSATPKVAADAPKFMQDSFVKPLVFEQKFLVCNAYSHEKPVVVTRNEKEELTHGLTYKSCEYLKAKLQEGDKLDFNVVEGIAGTFEVTDLPKDDAVLLLVFERRDLTSNLVSFRSYAFPHNTQQSAQVAVIDTFKDYPAKLSMEDHMDTKNHERVEDLEFNKVFSIEPGRYDVNIMYQEGEKTMHTAKKLLQLSRGGDYVVLRTGTNDPEGQDLVLFQSGAAQVVASVLLFFAL